MERILTTKQAVKLAQKLHKEGKTIIVAGGVFDILHIGHVKFLERAKKQGDFLFVLLESDENVRKTKGKSRPINTQKNRAAVLAALRFVDFVILLPEMTRDEEYDTLMAEILPEVIATTNHDPSVKHKERQAEKIGAKLKYVTGRIKNFSSSRYADFLEI